MKLMAFVKSPIALLTIVPSNDEILLSNGRSGDLQNSKLLPFPNGESSPYLGGLGFFIVYFRRALPRSRLLMLCPAGDMSLSLSPKIVDSRIR